MDDSIHQELDFYELSITLENYISDKKLAGLVAIVYHNDKIVYSKHLGVTDLNNSIPMQRDSLFHVASMTKPITSAIALMLLDEGKFILDDSIKEYVPQAADLKVFVREENRKIITEDLKRAITLKKLLIGTL